MSHVSRGSAAENFVVRYFEAMGYVAGSRRHIGGPADQLFVHPKGCGEIEDPYTGDEFAWCLLVETKKCKKVWENFRLEDREAMLNQPLPFGSERLLVNVAGARETMRIDRIYREDEWPQRP